MNGNVFMTGFLYSGTQDPAQIHFNNCHKAARMLIEALFGRWKNKFRNSMLRAYYYSQYAKAGSEKCQMLE